MEPVQSWSNSVEKNKADGISSIKYADIYKLKGPLDGHLYVSDFRLKSENSAFCSEIKTARTSNVYKTLRGIFQICNKLRS